MIPNLKEKVINRFSKLWEIYWSKKKGATKLFKTNFISFLGQHDLFDKLEYRSIINKINSINNPNLLTNMYRDLSKLENDLRDHNSSGKVSLLSLIANHNKNN